MGLEDGAERHRPAVEAPRVDGGRTPAECGEPGIAADDDGFARFRVLAQGLVGEVGSADDGNDSYVLFEQVGSDYDA